MKVIIAGSRGFKHPYIVNRAINKSSYIVSEVVSGTARGIDQFGEIWADNCEVPIKRFPADWDKYGKSAGYKRNQQMAEYADALIAIWDGESKGTKHMIDIMTKLNKPVSVYTE